MENSIKYILVFGVFSLCSVALGQVRMSSIRVMDGHGHPVANARMTSTSGYFNGVSDANGYFHLGQPAGANIVNVIHEDYVGVPGSGSQLTGSQNGELIIHEDPVKYPFDGVPIHEPRHTETIQEEHEREAAEKAKMQAMMEEAKRNPAVTYRPPMFPTTKIKKPGF
jgi:hypothetical protein